MQKLLLGLATSTTLFSGMAEAASYTVSANSPFIQTELDDTIQVAAFDDMGGTRQLTSVDYRIWADFYGDFGGTRLPESRQSVQGGIDVTFFLNSDLLDLSNATIFLIDGVSWDWQFGDYFQVMVDDADDLYGSVTSGLAAFSAASWIPLSFETQTDFWCSTCSIGSANARAWVFLDVTYTYENVVSTVPLPANLLLLLSGLGGMAGISFRKRRKLS